LLGFCSVFKPASIRRRIALLLPEIVSKMREEVALAAVLVAAASARLELLP
jgi:hypothetical protein